MVHRNYPYLKEELSSSIFSTKWNFGATTFSKITLSTTTFSIMTLSIKGLFETLSINDSQHKKHSS